MEVFIMRKLQPFGIKSNSIIRNDIYIYNPVLIAAQSRRIFLPAHFLFYLFDALQQPDRRQRSLINQRYIMKNTAAVKLYRQGLLYFAFFYYLASSFFELSYGC